MICLISRQVLRNLQTYSSKLIEILSFIISDPKSNERNTFTSGNGRFMCISLSEH